MYDIITFGAAAQDIYLRSKNFLPLRAKKFVSGEGICLNLGSKIEVDDILICSGGGGTNAAATFAKQGFKVAYCGIVGHDPFGHLLLEELNSLGVGVNFMRATHEKSTNISVFLAYPGKDRTILVYRGASDVLRKKDIPFSKIKGAKWFYLAPFSGRLAGLTKDLIGFAEKNRIKVAFNPGYKQLDLPEKTIVNLLKKVDVLILNREEASKLAKVSYQNEKEIFKKIDQMTKGIVIMTKGREGAAVSDGKYYYRAKSLGLKGVDSTGAGDAFGSGFIAGLMQKNDITFAIQLAMANSGLAITKWGAKEGLLEKNQKWPKTEVLKEPCAKNGFCMVKKT